MSTSTLEEFRSKACEIVDLRAIQENLEWDHEVMMPAKGSPLRASQASTLAATVHRRIVDPRMGDLIEELSEADLDEWDRASVREAKREHDRVTKVPESLVRELARARTLTYAAWVEARKNSDFESFAPLLEKLVSIKRNEARCLADGGCLYDALHDLFEPGMTSSRLDVLFGRMRPQLTDLLERIRNSSVRPDHSLLEGEFSIELQREFGKKVLTAMGFDWEAGRLDVSAHPFCVGLSPQDVRMTARYTSDTFAQSLFGMIHECGHGLYEQGLDAVRYGQPASQAVSLGIHESQSRLWENFIGRGQSFWSCWLPALQETFSESLSGVELDAFLTAINRVEASFIRVEADEVTYGLHIILRYELEKALIEGELEVSQLQQAWDDRMQEYLGIRPRNAAEGVLQDVHWSMGMLGYFPTYQLGNLYAGQLYRQANLDLPDLQRIVSQGQLLPLREWLREKVHQRGRLLLAEELIEDITGEPLDPRHFLDYLETKYARIYRLD